MSGFWAGWKWVGWPGWSGMVEIAALAAVFYYGMLFFRGTRGAQMLWGFLSLVAMLFVTRVLSLNTLNWLLQQVTGSLVVAAVVIFQPEIRRALAELGKQHLRVKEEREDVADEVAEAVLAMSAEKCGALIALERGVGTKGVLEQETRLDAVVSSKLLRSIFYPRSALHDGGVVIEGGRVRAAGCVFPLSENRMAGRSGTRHRAALGLSEETDALVLVVSEETGAVSLAVGGHLRRGLDEKELRRYLQRLYVRRGTRGPWWRRLKEGLDLSVEAMERNDA